MVVTRRRQRGLRLAAESLPRRPPAVPPAAMYSVDLLYAQPPALPVRELLAALRARCPGLEPATRPQAPDLLTYVQTRHVVRYRGGSAPAQLLVIPGRRERGGPTLADSVQQSWTQKDARALVGGAAHVVFVSDMMASGLPYKERLTTFLDALAAVVEAVPCRAIHWRASQQVIAPERFLEAHAAGLARVLRAGPLNVRFYDARAAKLVDSMGLAALGLPDVQCHFRGLDPDEVVRRVYDLGQHLFENGDAIEDGQTVTGAGGSGVWTCRRREALVAPPRTVLDLDPGPLFSGR